MLATQPSAVTRCVDPLEYCHPYFSRIIHHTYMVILRQTPEVWEAMYDSAGLDKLTRRIRWLIQRGKSDSFVGMISDFRPDAVVCTQAYSYGLMCAFLRSTGARIRLFGVVTDYRPHRFWAFRGCERGRIFVPAVEAAERLVRLGVPSGAVVVSGIPIAMTNGQGRHAPASDGQIPRLLVMGGSLGLGADSSLVRLLDTCRLPFVIDVVTGSNLGLRRRLVRARGAFGHRVRVRGFVSDVRGLMARATLLVSKPGGLTCAEAMASGLPMVIVNPLPGQETGNTRYLVDRGAALYLENEKELPAVIDMLLRNREILSLMRQRALELAIPDAAATIARAVLSPASRN